MAEPDFAVGCFAYGATPTSLNYKKVGWMTKVGPRRVTIQYVTGKHATWARKNIVLVPRDNVDPSLFDNSFYTEFYEKKGSNVYPGFDQTQENMINDLVDWVSSIEDKSKKNDDNLSERLNEVEEMFNLNKQQCDVNTNMFNSLSDHLKNIMDERIEMIRSYRAMNLKIRRLEEMVEALQHRETYESDGPSVVPVRGGNSEIEDENTTEMSLITDIDCLE